MGKIHLDTIGHYGRQISKFRSIISGYGLEHLCERCRAIEEDPMRCDLIVRRWEQFTR